MGGEVEGPNMERRRFSPSEGKGLDESEGKDEQEEEKEFKPTFIRRYLIGSIITHTLMLIGIYNLPRMHPATIAFIVASNFLCQLAVTAGTHRLWTHRAYKATLPLKLFLAYFFCMSMQYSIIDWVKFHRVHHKFSDTDADPHNIKRGFLWAQHLWGSCVWHPAARREVARVDVSDLKADPLIMFEHRYHIPLTLVTSLVIPTVIPCLLWQEAPYLSFLAAITRRNVGIHITSLINSFAHMWGDRPYDANIPPAQNWICSLFTLGEGLHNYHHAFPSDYRTSEWSTINTTTHFIDACSWLGLAYDLRTVGDEAIKMRIERTGPGGNSSRDE